MADLLSSHLAYIAACPDRPRQPVREDGRCSYPRFRLRWQAQDFLLTQSAKRFTDITQTARGSINIILERV